MQDNDSNLSFAKRIIINGKQINLKVHFGTAYSIISKSTMDTLLGGEIHLLKSKVNLH